MTDKPPETNDKEHISDSGTANVLKFGPRKSASSKRNILEDREVQKYAIPMALERLLISLDQCRYLLDSSRSNNINARPPQGFESKLPARERKELDREIELFRKEVKERVRKEVESLADESKVTDNYDGIYPLAGETAWAVTQIVLGKVNKEVADEYFIKYKNDGRKLEYIMARSRLGDSGEADALLGAALVPIIVSKMEEFLGALIRSGLSLYPTALGGLPSVPNDIFTLYRANITSADIERWQIDQKVNGMISGSPPDWQKAIERWTKIDISKLGGDWDILQEMIQRRHAIIHAGGRVDSEYLAKVPSRLKHGLTLGSDLLSGYTYIVPVMVELETWAICLMLQWAKNFFAAEDIIYNPVWGRVPKLEGLGRWTQALAVLDTVLLEPAPSDNTDFIIANINRWFCLQELGQDNDALRREICAADLTATDLDLERAARCALIRDYEGMIKELRSATEGQYAHMPKRDVIDMPLFQRAMKESAKASTFLLSAGRPPQGPPPNGRSRKRRGRR
jgi:hypothetical protein